MLQFDIVVGTVALANESKQTDELENNGIINLILNNN